MNNLERIIKKYEPDNYKLIKKPLVKEESNYSGIGCVGNYSNIKYGIDPVYWEQVINADELINE